MTNLNLQKKAIERNKFYAFLMSAAFLVFSGFLLYLFISSVNDTGTQSLYMLGSTLYTLPFLIIFFIFFTFECCHKISNYYESVCVTKKNIGYIYKKQIQIIFLYELFMFIEALFFNIIYIFVNSQFSFSLILHTFVVLIIYFLLCLSAAIFIGFMLSQIKHKIISYVIMIVIAISQTNLTDSLSAGIYNKFGTDITKLFKLFYLIPPSIYWTPNMHSGYIITFDKLSQILLFIFLSLFVFYIIHRNIFLQNNGKIKAAICCILCVITIIGYILPYSAPQMDLSASGVSADQRYYENESTAQLSETAEFKVESYNIEFKFINQLYAVAKIKVDNNALGKYKFTLYHGYKINKITDEDGKNLSFTRNSDYLTVTNSTQSNYFNVYYSGSSSKFYSNLTDAFLPGYFAYYPIPGFNEMFSTSTYLGFNDLALSYEVNFDVKVKSLRKMICNLDNVSDNEFEGKSNSLTLLGGFMKSVKVNNTDVYYPYFDNAYNSDIVNEKLKDFLSNNPQLKKIIIIPGINLEDIEFAKIYDDYMITASVDDIERAAFISKINARKMELYNAVDAYLNYPEYFEFLKENSSDELKTAILVLEKVLSNDTDGKKVEKINKYLTDKTDNRNFSEFLNEMG